MGLFSKNLDYNLVLENVLDEKHFSANIKSLLLSMLYKIETSYIDYAKVKQIKKTKEELLSEIINIINEFFDLVKVVEPVSKQAKILKDNKVIALTNEKERSLLAYPTEIAMLYAIADIEPKFFYIEKFILKKEFQQMLVEGSNLNFLEILEDFNGWSWNPKYLEEKNSISNLIYQNLIIMFGLEFVENCKKSSNKEFDIIKKIKELYPEYYNKLINLIYLKYKNTKFDKIIKEKVLELSEISNTEEYLEKLAIEKSKLAKKVKKIENILRDPEEMNKSFNTKSIQNKKFASIEEYRIWLTSERNKYLRRLKEILELKNPRSFATYKDELYEYKQLSNLNISLDEAIIELQKSFINILNDMVKKINSKEEFIKLIYNIRYYNNIYIYKDIPIKKCTELSELNDVLKKLITYGSKNNYIKICSLNINLNAQILMKVLDTKIIDLQTLKIKIEEKEQCLFIDIFENDTYEKRIELKYNLDNPELMIKQQKKVKIFI